MFFRLKKILIAASILFIGSTITSAQDTTMTSLSLSEATEQTLMKNHDIRLTSLAHETSQFDVKMIKSRFLPQIDVSANATANNLPMHVFGSRLQQGGITQEDFIPSSLNNPSSITNLQTQLRVLQPILNLDFRSAVDAQIARSKATSQQAKRTKKEIYTQVVLSYLQLQLTHEMADVLLKAKQTADANLKLTRDNLEAGYLQKVDVISVELRINEIEHQIFTVKNNIENISNQLSVFMGARPNVIYKPTDKLIDKNEISVLTSQVSSTSSDVKMMEFIVEAQKHMLASSQNASLPKVNAFGSYELNNNLDFRDAQHGYMVGIQATVNLFDGHRNQNSVQKAKIDLQKSQTQLDQFVVRKNLAFEVAKRDLLNARDKIQLTKKAIEQAKEYQRIKRNRYAEGLEKTTDMLMAEMVVTQKEMDYVEAVYEAKVSLEKINLILDKG